MTNGLLGEFEMFPVVLPMRMRFRRVDERRAVIIRGPSGWGEFSPFSEYPPEVTSRWLAAALEAACAPWPEPRRVTVPVNVTVPAVPPGQAADLVIQSKCRTAKVKVAEPGEGPADDMRRVEAVRAALGPAGRIRLDANGACDVPTAVDRIRQLERYGLEYVEQPVPTIDEMVEVRRSVDIPIAADESVRAVADPRQAAGAGAADIYVLKVQPLGGMVRTLTLAESVGLPVVVSSALETSVGMSAECWTAACLPELPYACGLGTVTMLAEGVVRRPLVPIDGEVSVARCDPDPELLERHRPDRDRCDEMLHRVQAAAELLT